MALLIPNIHILSYKLFPIYNSSKKATVECDQRQTYFSAMRLALSTVILNGHTCTHVFLSFRTLCILYACHLLLLFLLVIFPVSRYPVVVCVMHILLMFDK